MVSKPFRIRRQLLRDNFQEVEGEFVFAKSMISSNTEEIEDFLEESIKGTLLYLTYISAVYLRFLWIFILTPLFRGFYPASFKLSLIVWVMGSDSSQ